MVPTYGSVGFGACSVWVCVDVVYVIKVDYYTYGSVALSVWVREVFPNSSNEKKSKGTQGGGGWRAFEPMGINPPKQGDVSMLSVCPIIERGSVNAVRWT